MHRVPDDPSGLIVLERLGRQGREVGEPAPGKKRAKSQEDRERPEPSV